MAQKTAYVRVSDSNGSNVYSMDVTQPNAFTHSMTGGVNSGGSAGTSQADAYAHTMTGGVTSAGSAEVAVVKAYSHQMSGGIQGGGSATVAVASAQGHVMAGGVSSGGSAAVAAVKAYSHEMTGGLAGGGSASSSLTTNTNSYTHTMSGGAQAAGSSEVFYQSVFNKTAYVRLQDLNGSTTHSVSLSQPAGQWVFSMSGGVQSGGTFSLLAGNLYSVVVTTPNANTTIRLVSSPDLATGNIIAWANVVGGELSDVSVNPDGTWSATSGVSSFDWRVFDGTEWGEWATQYIEVEGANQNSHAMTGGATVEGSSTVTFVGLNTWSHSMSGGAMVGGTAAVEHLQAHSHTMSGGLQGGGAAAVEKSSAYSHTMSGGLQGGGAAGANYGADNQHNMTGGLVSDGASNVVYVSFNQNSHTASGGAQLGGSSNVVYLPLNAFSHEMQGGISGAGSSVVGYQGQLNEHNHAISGGIVLSGQATISSGNFVAETLTGDLAISSYGYNPGHHSRFLPRYHPIIGEIVVGSAGRLGVMLSSRAQNGVWTPIDLSNVERVVLRLGNSYEIEQVAGESPERMEWAGGLPQGLIYINSEALLSQPIRPDTYLLRLEVFMAGASSGYGFPTYQDRWVKVVSWD